jgi:hypothetical protein
VPAADQEISPVSARRIRRHKLGDPLRATRASAASPDRPQEA